MAWLCVADASDWAALISSREQDESNDSYAFLLLAAAVKAADLALDAVLDAKTASLTSFVAATAEDARADCHPRSTFRGSMTP
jgi:hypothetical protein